MRTLDEVINIFEKACDLERRCEDCSGCLGQESGCPNDGANAVPDALHYLKVMRSQIENMIADNAVFEGEQYDVWVKDNTPLTWDELRTMECKPVWIEFLNDEGKWNGEWCLVESSKNLICEILRCKMTWWALRKIALGKTWNAFRKERG